MAEQSELQKIISSEQASFCPGYADEDIEFVESTLEKFFLQAKGDITARLLSRYQTQYEIAIKEKEQLQARHQAENAELRKQLSDFEIKFKADAGKLEAMYAFQADFAIKWEKNRSHARTKELSSEIFGSWLLAARKRIDRQKKLAAGIRNLKTALVRRSLSTWRTFVIETKRAQEHEFWQKQMKEFAQKLVLSYEKKIEEQREQLALQVIFTHQAAS